jgi:hypothetical protein
MVQCITSSMPLERVQTGSNGSREMISQWLFEPSDKLCGGFLGANNSSLVNRLTTDRMLV